jgi:hypothetical protein
MFSQKHNHIAYLGNLKAVRSDSLIFSK